LVWTIRNGGSGWWRWFASRKDLFVERNGPGWRFA